MTVPDAGENPLTLTLATISANIDKAPMAFVGANAVTNVLPSFTGLGFATNNLDAASQADIATLLKVGTDTSALRTAIAAGSVPTGLDVTVATDIRNAGIALLDTSASWYNNFDDPAGAATNLVSAMSLNVLGQVGTAYSALNVALINNVAAGATVTDIYRGALGLGVTRTEAMAESLSLFKSNAV